MHIWKSSSLAIWLASLSVASAMLNCDIHVDGVSFDLSLLNGTHQVSRNFSTPPSTSEYLWLFDPCGTIVRDNSKIPVSEECPVGSQICGIQRIELPGKDPLLASIIPVAGDLDGKQSGAKIERLKTISDENKEGLRVTLKGPSWGPSENLHGVVDFVCPKEGESEEELSYESWDLKYLKLKWVTKYACENATSIPSDGDDNSKPGKEKEGGDDGNKKEGTPKQSEKSWGWFTWLFIIFVLGTAGYVIAGAWVNYNRYGLSGVDVLPHSDLLRDMPFLVNDLIRKIAGTFSAGNSRGGYSAV